MLHKLFPILPVWFLLHPRGRAGILAPAVDFCSVFLAAHLFPPAADCFPYSKAELLLVGLCCEQSRSWSRTHLSLYRKRRFCWELAQMQPHKQ